jgi:hypothetical protein
LKKFEFIGEKMERVKGIEPSSQAWEARILPLNHTRLSLAMYYQSFCQVATAFAPLSATQRDATRFAPKRTAVLEGVIGSGE